MEGVRRTFGRTEAVAGVTLAIEGGEAVALVGENGAGKSTLMRIVAGVERADAGTVRAAGIRIDAPDHAARAGIRMVHQHFNLAGALTVAENLVLHEPDLPAALDRGTIERVARTMVERAGIPFEGLDRPAAALSIGEMARVEMIRALSRSPRVLILDEPTSVLTPLEVSSLLASLRRLAGEGLAVVLISHKLEEVFAFARRVVVMRQGTIALDADAKQTSSREVARAMVGRALEVEGARLSGAAGERRLVLRGVNTEESGLRVPLRGVSLEVGRGEIVAIVGVAGNGQNALADLLRGVIPAADGRIEIDGRPMRAGDLFAAADAAHIPSDRTREGIVAGLSLAENLALRADSVARARQRAREAIARYQIRGRAEQLAESLSGGNQQKLLLARELTETTGLIVASEPTRGLDFESTRFVHGRIRDAADRGAAVLLITSDLDEAAALAGSVQVMSGGRLSERLPSSTPAEELALRMAGAR